MTKYLFLTGQRVTVDGVEINQPPGAYPGRILAMPDPKAMGGHAWYTVKLDEPFECSDGAVQDIVYVPESGILSLLPQSSRPADVEAYLAAEDVPWPKRPTLAF